MLPQPVQDKLESLPVQPGVYLFKDKKGDVVYVGKAKSLRSRVRSYFQAGSGDSRYFIPFLHRTIGDLDVIVTGSEKEATILENTLIKEHRPRYNVKLRDDKEYLSIRIDTKAPWPRIEVVRKPKADGARYFGPYHSATSARRTLHLINKHFQLRTCTDAELASRRRPCLQHQIKRCPAPCVLAVDRGWYGEQVDTVVKFLDGRHDELENELITRMQTSARQMRFELAAVYRDQLRAIEKVREDQRVVSTDRTDRDVIGLHREGDMVELALLHVRAGKLADVTTYSLRQCELPDEEIVAAFLAQHYGGAEAFEPDPGDDENGADLAEPTITAPEGVSKGAARPPANGATPMPLRDAAEVAIPVPREILLPVEPDGLDGIAEFLGDRAAHKVSLVVPKRGPRAELLKLAADNARHAFLEKRRSLDDVEDRLRQMQERLRLPSLPRRIECCDISHLGGGDTVGAVVAMRDGVLDRKRYRTFHVRGLTDTQAGGDDYAAMYEVLARRFRRGIAARQAEGGAAPVVEEAAVPEENLDEDAAVDAAPPGRAPESEAPPSSDRSAASASGPTSAGEENAWELPDLFVVDGGRGQLGVALAAAHDLGLHDLPIVGLAKEKENVAGETLVDRVYLPGQKNPITLKSHSSALFFLARLRDEAHRVSNRGREKKGKARRLRSTLEDVPGIGPATRKALLTHLGSLAAVQAADDATILAVPGVNKRHLTALRRVFRAPGAPLEVAPEAASETAPEAASEPTASPVSADDLGGWAPVSEEPCARERNGDHDA